MRARSLKEHLRAREIVEQARLLPRPWGIFGSAWQTDLEFWGKELQDLPGTLWIVPHHIDETTVGLMERLIQSLGMKVFRSTDQWHSVRSGAVNPKVILVNEMGFLSELYRHGDWAYVGGGHGKSLHSTIEPAIHGIAMAAGPQGASRFSEIEVLMETGQLRLLESNSDLLEWKMQMREQEWKRRDPHWLTAIEDRYGATERVWSVICQTLDGSLGN